MRLLKSYLNESPDGIELKNGKLLSYEETVSIFMIYDDLVDEKKYWVSYNPQPNNLLSNNESLKNELDPEKYKSYSAQIKDRNSHFNIHSLKDKLYKLKQNAAHYTLVDLLQLIGRATLKKYKPESSKTDFYITGRLFLNNETNKYYFSFWEKDLLIKKNKTLIDEFVNKSGYYINSIYIETYNDNIVSYNSFFNKKETSKVDNEIRKKQADIHKLSSLLPKKYLDQLRKL